MEIRFLNDLRETLYDKEWAKTAPNLKLYYMYRGVKKKRGLRYDITVIPPRMLGKEFVKTKGNRNSDNFPELYTILQGRAVFLMQQMAGRIVKDIKISKLKMGDWIVVPADYFIVVINPAKKFLKLGNWVSEKNKNSYQELEKMKGAGYYYLKSGWTKNKNYKKIPILRLEKSLKSRPKNLDFLYGDK